ncbi:hypothetical protein [Frankia sp. CiP3]|uniref:hypothetical protein n=1 Tax=Frankia sp. CiP3 TaxID=2880971 RepID=UPI001EF4778A|nr:hypothetical protein [Frankia sp. CiP3]
MPSDLERSRLLLVWLQARRAVDHCLSDLLAAGPAGERRVREQLELVNDLENRAQEAFVRYRRAAANTRRPAGSEDTATSDVADVIDIADVTTLMDRTGSTGRPRLGVVQPDDRGHQPGRLAESQRPSGVPGTGLRPAGPVSAVDILPDTATGPGTAAPASKSGTGLGTPAAGTEPGAFPGLPGAATAAGPHTGADGESRGTRRPRGDQRRYR